MLKQFTKDAFFRNNIIYFAGSMAVAFLNYLYHPVLSRLMTVREFGEVQVLFSIFLQAGIIFGFFSLVTVNITTNTSNQEEREKRLSDLYTLSLYITLPLSLLLLVLSPYLKNALEFSSAWPLVVLALILASSAPFNFQRSYLQGLQDFSGTSWAGIILAGGRLILGVGLILIGSAVFGAIAGLALANLLAIYYLHYRTGQSFFLKPSFSLHLGSIKRELPYGALVVFSAGFITLLHTTDVIIVKYLFPPDIVGLYAGISTIAKTILFATGSVTAVLLPAIKQHHNAKENRRIFLKSFLLTMLIGGGALFLFVLFPNLIITLLIGSGYISFASYLPKLSFLMFVISVANLFFYYFLALRNFLLIPISFLGAVLIALRLYFYHASVQDVIDTFLYGTLFTLALLLLLYVFGYMKSRHAQ